MLKLLSLSMSDHQPVPNIEWIRCRADMLNADVEHGTPARCPETIEEELN